ncbi:hypothetical protein BDV95DRAFT_592768 [Massariosphaeria phaeospora]|uniref:Uncharacterized protein n=1 Tax=Massariosphaeria phaeospora TaxID=100035 RepID=A0A7C8IG60_9PLEO|nr:hypothetical protein BDV95DRAFT_592768 [Massariosphaeria phaeospora]
MSDMQKAFTYLHDNIPSWFETIAEVQEKISRMQEEVAKIPVSRSPPMKRKTGSIESIRDLDAIIEEPCSPLASKKRKTPSFLSAHASGVSKYRSKTMILVYYDGQIQKSFETLVRSIGTGRNMLRKGKMAAKLQEMADLAGSEDDDDEDDMAMAKIGYRHRTGLSSIRTRAMAMRGSLAGISTSSSRTPIELFDVTEKALELAQGLCERAAHQSLRDGECRKELDGVRQHFEGILESAKKEVAKCQAQGEKDLATEEPRIAVAPIVAPIVARAVERKMMIPEIQPMHNGTATATLRAVEIEVDDEDDDEIDFVMPPIRLTSRV